MCCPHCVQICLHGGGQQRIHRDRRKFILLHAIYFSLCSPEGLKKVRNPDRMYRTAVCYAGHGPPKSISDDTEMNSKSYSYLHRSYKRPLAGHCVMTSSVYPLTFSLHLLLLSTPSLQVLLVQECVLLIQVCALQDHVLKAVVLLLTRSDCFRLRPGIRTRANPSERMAAC